MSGVNPIPPDLAPALRDLGRDCSNLAGPAGNRLQNPSFEAGDGSANSMANPASTIASWTGYGGTGAGTTSWTVSQMSTYCGSRAVKVTGTGSVSHVLLQTFNSPGDAGHQFLLTGRVFVTAIDASGGIKLDMWDLLTGSMTTSTLALTMTSSDWVTLSQSGSIPPGGNFQVRINNSGNVEAYVDDLALVIQ
jgi:hypothetical protein